MDLTSEAVIAIVDTGPLYAAVDLDDADHAACVGALAARGLRLIIPAMVVAEVTYLVALRMGPQVEAGFLRGLAHYDVDVPPPGEWARIAELVEEYADFPLGGTDASVVAAAERLGADHVITLDHRHFSAVRPRHCAYFTLMP